MSKRVFGSWFGRDEMDPSSFCGWDGSRMSVWLFWVDDSISLFGLRCWDDG